MSAVGRKLPTPIGSLVTAGLLGLFSLVVSYLIVREAVGSHLADEKPSAAVAVYPASAAALTALAQAHWAAGRWDDAVVAADRAARISPLSLGPLLIQIRDAERRDERSKADDLLAFAGARSWRVSAVHIQLLERKFARGSYEEAMDHADALVRRQDAPWKIVLLFVGQAPADRVARPLAAKLAGNPPWREAMIRDLSRAGNLDLVHSLLTSLKKASVPPRDTELRAYFEGMASRGQYRAAREQWPSLVRYVVPPDPIYDAEFNGRPGPYPFSWSLGEGAGYSAEVSQAPGRPSGDRALHVTHDGASPADFARQLIVLRPGAHRLTGEQFSDGVLPEMDIRWTLTCANDGRVIATVPPASATTRSWAPLEAAFAIPAENCDAQWMFLTTRLGERRAVSVWFDNLAIDRQAAHEGATPASSEDRIS